jgi:signal transduction histidine kinase/ActR/RegA family two-component response regulator
VLLQLDETFILMLNAETAIRGFMVRKDETLLQPYFESRQNAAETFTKLRRLTDDIPEQAEKIAQLEELINKRLALFGEVSEARRTKSIEQVQEQFASRGGRELADSVRVLVNEIKTGEQKLLAEREENLDKSLDATAGMIYAIGFAGLLSLGLACFTIFREIGKRRKAEAGLRDANKSLEERVEKRTFELSKTNLELNEEIEKRKASESVREELLRSEQTARKDAEIANRLRDEFLATVSHELRAPLNSIMGWGRLLETGNLDEQTNAKALETIIRNAEAQNRLIEDLLDVSRIITGKLRLEVMNVKPVIFVEAALESLRPAADAKGIALEIREDPVVSHISGDPNRMQQVIWNLLSNAIKFTPNGGMVSVEIARTNGNVSIQITDSGIGIRKEFLPHVFDRFRQADASSIRKFGGLGLGLSIVRHLTEMHGGTVSATSGGEDKGSTFTVSLPVIGGLDEPPRFGRRRESKRRAAEAATNLNLDGLLILAVDDEEDTCQLLVQALTFHGATVITANSAARALTEVIDKSPDVIVSDIGMPGEDGYSLIRKVRALPDENQKKIKAVALTSYARAQDRMQALAAGFQSHVGKPVEPDELATVIASLTGRLNTTV